MLTAAYLISNRSLAYVIAIHMLNNFNAIFNYICDRETHVIEDCKK